MRFDSFWDELSKIAVSLADLNKLTRLAKRKTIKTPMVDQPAALPRGGMRSLMSSVRSKGDPETTKRVARLSKIMGGKLGYPRRGGAFRALKRAAVKPGRGRQGALQARYNKSVAAVAGDPQSRRATEGIVAGHELQELAKGRSRYPISGQQGGHRPGVIPVEHNIVTTLPKEVAPAGRLMRDFRELGPDASLFEQATRGPAGVGMAFGKGPRLSRHAVRRIGQRMEELERQMFEAQRLGSRRRAG